MEVSEGEQLNGVGIRANSYAPDWYTSYIIDISQLKRGDDESLDISWIRLNHYNSNFDLTNIDIDNFINNGGYSSYIIDDSHTSPVRTLIGFVELGDNIYVVEKKFDLNNPDELINFKSIINSIDVL